MILGNEPTLEFDENGNVTKESSDEKLKYSINLLVQSLVDRIFDLEAIEKKFRNALTLIDIHPIDYRIGVAENVQIVSDIAHKALTEHPE